MDDNKIVEITTIEELIEMSTMAGGAVQITPAKNKKGKENGF